MAVVGEEARLNPVTRQQHTGMARVLAQDGVRSSELGEHPQGDVGEVPNRCGADGEWHVSPHPIERLEPDECRPDQAGLLTERGLDDPQRLVGRLDRLSARRNARRVEYEITGRCAEAASDDHDVRVEDVDERSDGDPKQPADLRQRLDRARVAGTGTLDERRRLRARAEELGSDPICRKARCDSLEMPSPMAVSLTGLASGDYDDVPELGPPAIETIVDDKASAHAGAEGEHDQIRCSLAGAELPFRKRGGIPVVLNSRGQPVAVPRPVGKVHCVERKICGPHRHPGAPIDIERNAVPDRSNAVREKVVDDTVDRRQHLLLGPARRRDLDRASDRTVARDNACENLRPAEVHSNHAIVRHSAATISARMPEQEKPYRVYRGGRAKGRVPLQRPTDQKPANSGAERAPRKPRRLRLGRRLALAVVLVFLLGGAWLVASYLSFSKGISDANARVPAPVVAELAPQDGLLISMPTTILVLGTDGGTEPGRGDANRSDSIMLIRTDPRRHRLAFLSIPRDLRVEIPGSGAAKINAAFQIGGATLALRTVKSLTGLDVNHVTFVDFDRFRELINSVGGIRVDVPRPILSNRFDCPYATAARCQAWDGWRFERGTQQMDGQRALVYSRIRENRLDSSETDLDRARRQQQVIQATADKVTSLGTALRLPFRGDSIVKPLATDLSAGQVLQLGWAYFRANTEDALHCRLGGEPGSADGQSVIFGSEDNVATVAMFTGRSAPLPPPKGLPYAPGCVIGDRRP